MPRRTEMCCCFTSIETTCAAEGGCGVQRLADAVGVRAGPHAPAIVRAACPGRPGAIGGGVALETGRRPDEEICCRQVQDSLLESTRVTECRCTHRSSVDGMECSISEAEGGLGTNCGSGWHLESLVIAGAPSYPALGVCVVLGLCPSYPPPALCVVLGAETVTIDKGCDTPETASDAMVVEGTAAESMVEHSSCR